MRTSIQLQELSRSCGDESWFGQPIYIYSLNGYNILLGAQYDETCKIPDLNDACIFLSPNGSPSEVLMLSTDSALSDPAS